MMLLGFVEEKQQSEENLSLAYHIGKEDNKVY
jgi:hypothetical protein